MITRNFEFDNNAISEGNFKKLLELLSTTKYGSVSLVLQDGVVIQIERIEKLRLR